MNEEEAKKKWSDKLQSLKNALVEEERDRLLKLFVRAAEAQKYFLDQGFLPHAGFCNYQIPFEG